MTPSQPGPRIIRFGVFEVDRSAGQLLKRGRPVKLTRQPFKVLLLLLDRHGYVVSRADIQRHVWGDSTFVDFERGINFSINQIRVALGDSPDRPRYIETLPKLGYRFLGEVTQVPGPDPIAPAARPVGLESDVTGASTHAMATPDLRRPGDPDELLRVPTETGPVRAPTSTPHARTRVLWRAESLFEGKRGDAGLVDEKDTTAQNAPADVAIAESQSGSEGAPSGRRPVIRYLLSGGVLLVALASIATLVRNTPGTRAAAAVARGMRLTRLTQNGNIREIAISPDGRHVTFAVTEGAAQSLWLRDVPSGYDVQLLAPDTVNFSGLEFSPDGGSIYFIRSERTNPVFSYLCRMPSAGGQVEQLIRDADSPAVFRQTGNVLSTHGGIHRATSPR